MYTFFLIRSIDPLCSWKVIIWEVHSLNTFLYLTDYIRENTNLDDEQIEKELDLLGENNSSDTVRSLYNEWCSLRFKPIDVPVFRSKKESINLCLDPDKFSEYRYIMKGRKLINITAKEIKYRQHNILLHIIYLRLYSSDY